MLGRKKLAAVLNQKGLQLKNVETVNKWNAKVRKVELVNHPPVMLKTWPFYPLRFSKVQVSKKWVTAYLADCARPLNELKINNFIKAKTKLRTPELYLFERVFPFKSLKYWYIMLQEDLCQEGYRDFKDVLTQLVELKKYDSVYFLMEKIAQTVETLFEINVFSDDYYFDNFMINDENTIALIDFEKSFICHDSQKIEEYKKETVTVLIGSYNKLTQNDPAFSLGLTPLLAIHN